VIVLVGFMGAGKTTVGQLLADRLGVPFLDSDLMIEARTGRAVREIFATEGEPVFREMERTVIAGLVTGPDAVLSLGGGAAEHPATRQVLAGVPIVYLRVEYKEALARVGGDAGRPMLARPGLPDLYARRLAVYESVASLTVATDGLRPEDVVAEILAEYPRALGNVFTGLLR
jgi:shikimate kinase